MATFRQAINRVLISLGLGDDQVSDSATELTDRYHTKVAQVINDILEEIEEAAQWRALRQRDTATVSANAQSATLTNSNARSRVFKVHDAANGMLLPLVFDVTDTANQVRLKEMELAEMLLRDQEDDNTSYGDGPSHYALSPDGEGGMDIYLWPRQNASVDVEVDMIIPQSRLPHTSSAELDTEIKVPSLIVTLGATWWLMEDRGEEFGPRGDKQEMRYRNKLSDAVALEHEQQGLNDLVPV